MICRKPGQHQHSKMKDCATTGNKPVVVTTYKAISRHLIKVMRDPKITNRAYSKIKRKTNVFFMHRQ